MTSPNPDWRTQGPQYALAYDIAREALKRQEASVDEIRSRTATLIGAASLVTSFLGAVALGDGATPFAVIGVGAFLGTVVLCLDVLRPLRGWKFGSSARLVIRSYIAHPQPASIIEMHAKLAKDLDDSVSHNTPRLERLYEAFTAAGILLLVEVVAFVAEFVVQ
jgi:hypothetical protein